MAFRVPDTVFAPEHFGDGRRAPDCQILVFFDCDPDFCTAGEITAEIVEVSSKEVIAKGPVKCMGRPTMHQLQLLVKSPLRAIIVQIRFKCRADQDTEHGDTDRIWVSCS